MAILDFIISIIKGLLSIIASVFSISSSKKKRKQKERENIYVFHLPGGKGDYCTGRESEKRKVRKKILKKESLYIYGAVGIGKSNLVVHSILGVKTEIMNKYDGGVLYYDFAEGPAMKDAMKQLCTQIKIADIENTDTDRLKYSLSEKDYLIWLDSCERTTLECLDEILGLSYRPVFILCSREREQSNIFIKRKGKKNSIIKISFLSITNALNLLDRHLINWLPFYNKRKTINKKIVRFVGRHPFNIYLIKNKPLYQKNPEDYYRVLREKGLDSTDIEDKYIDKYQEYNMEMLIKESFGLEIDDSSQSLSGETKTALGFLGFLAEEAYNLHFFKSIDRYKEITLFTDKVIDEIEQTNLFIIEDGYLQAIHSAIYKVLNDQKESLLGSDFSCIFLFLALVNGEAMKHLEGLSGDMFNVASLSLYPICNHLFCCVTNIITNDNIKYEEEDVTCLFCSLYLLSTYGLYNEVLYLIDKFDKQFIVINNHAFELFAYAVYSSCEGLQLYDGCVFCMKEIIKATKEPCSNVVTFYINIIEAYLNSSRFSEAKQVLEDVKKYIEENSLFFEQKDFSEVKLSLELVEQRLKFYLKEDDISVFIENQLVLLRKLTEKYPEKDFMNIETNVLLMFAYIIMNDERAILIYDALQETLNNWVLSPGYYYTYYEIGDFFFKENTEIGYCIAYVAFRNLLIQSQHIYGNEHIITNRIRGKFIQCSDIINNIENTMKQKELNAKSEPNIPS